MAGVRADRSKERLTLTGLAIEIEAHLVNGTLAVSSKRWRPLPHAYATAELGGGRSISSAGVPWAIESAPKRFEDVHGRGVRAVLRSEAGGDLALLLELCVYEDQPFVLVRAGLRNGGKRAVQVQRLSPLATDRAAGGGLALASPATSWRFFRQGWQSWTPSMSLSGSQQDIDVRPPALAPATVPEGRGVFASEEVGALFDPESGRTLVLGFVTAHRQWTQVRLATGQGAIEAVGHTDGAAVAPGDALWSERLLIDLSDDAPPALERYAGALAREMRATVPSSSPTGWCSWYYYFWDVSEDEVLKNLRFLEANRGRLPIECVQIDDGYQANIGDWTETNERFPHGMAWLASEIRSAGFQPGIWLAPLMVGETSRLYKEHPSWVVHDEHATPVVTAHNWRQTVFGLDCTNPAAERWLRELFGEITNGWGYDYLKIDFLYGGALPGRRYDKQAGRIEAYRRGLRAIREAAPKSFILGCGSLLGPSVGLVDGQRNGPDVAPWWRYNRPINPPRGKGRPLIAGEPSTENSQRNILTRSWMHGHLWANDPDCLLVREDRTKLTLAEVQSLATAIALSGGMTLLSDNMPLVSDGRIEIASLLLPPLGVAATALDLMTASLPEYFALPIERPFERWLLLGRFNWLRKRRSLATALPPGRWHVFELWERRYHGEHEGEVLLPDVPAHGVALLALRRPKARPQLLGTTFHFSVVAVSLTNKSFRLDTLRVDLRPVAKKRGEVLVHVPKGHRFVEAELNGEAIDAERQGRNVVSLWFALEKPSTLVVRFRRAR